MNKKIISATILSTCYVFLPEIKELMANIYSYIIDLQYAKIVISRSNLPDSDYIIEHIYSVLEPSIYKKKLNMLANNYTILDGNYIITHRFFPENIVETINCSINKDNITLSMYVMPPISIISILHKIKNESSYPNIKQIKDTIQNCYIDKNGKTVEKFLHYIHCIKSDTAKYTINFTLTDDSRWSKPIVRVNRNITFIPLETQTLLDTVEDFLNNEDKYKKAGLRYQKGIILHGDPGTGKTTAVEVVAKQFGLSIYSINLMAKNLTDTKLIELCTNVLPNSIIVFDEFEKYYSKLFDPLSNITFGGILTAIDGTVRLQDGTIIIIIMNGNPHEVITDTLNRQMLTRFGRLDTIIYFTTLFIPPII